MLQVVLSQCLISSERSYQTCHYLPSNCSIVEIDAETAAVYYAINDNAADATAHGYIPTDGARFIGPLAGRFTMSVWGTAADAAVAHVQFFRMA